MITDAFMTLSVPGRTLELGTHLADVYPDALRDPAQKHAKILIDPSSRAATPG